MFLCMIELCCGWVTPLMDRLQTGSSLCSILSFVYVWCGSFWCTTQQQNGLAIVIHR